MKLDGFKTCDYDIHSNPDYQFDLEKDKFPFPDDSVDTVVASHVLEHLGEGFFHCIKELYRVCQHGAVIHIRVPHHRHDHFLNDPTHRRPITADGLRLFSKKYNDMCKAQGAAASRLGYYFEVDFEIEQTDEVPDDRYKTAFEGQDRDSVLRYLSEHNNIIQEVYIRWVVIKDASY